MNETTTDRLPTAEDSQGDAEQFLIGNLITAAKKRFITLAVPWHKLSEREQERTGGHQIGKWFFGAAVSQML